MRHTAHFNNTSSSINNQAVCKVSSPAEESLSKVPEAKLEPAAEIMP